MEWKYRQRSIRGPDKDSKGDLEHVSQTVVRAILDIDGGVYHDLHEADCLLFNLGDVGALCDRGSLQGASQKWMVSANVTQEVLVRLLSIG